MAQRNISDYYQICKKKNDDLHAIKLDKTRETGNVGKTDPPTKRKKIDDAIAEDSPLFKKQKAGLIFDAEPNQTASGTCPVCPLFVPTKSPPGSQQSILKWARNTNKLNRVVNHGYPNSNLIQVIPQQLPELLDRTGAFPLIATPECKAKRRLFCDLAELRDKIKSKATDGWMRKLKEFQEMILPCIKSNVVPISPLKHCKQQKQRKATAFELISLSPRKLLESLPKLSWKSSNQLAIQKPNEPVENSEEAPDGEPKEEAAEQAKEPAGLPKVQLPSALSLSPLSLGSASDRRKKKDRGLDLPESYLKLEKIFSHLETMITVMYNRQETCTFDKAKAGVQKMTKEDFNLKHLAQLLTIYPNAYKLSYEKLTSIEKLSSAKKGYCLVIKPNVLTSKMIPYTNQMRMNEFTENLHQFAKKVHADYLASLNEPVHVNSCELTRWHPSFIFPRVPEAELPAPPTESPTIKSIRDFWLKVKLEHKSDGPKPACAIGDNRLKIKQGLLKGLSQDLLDKVSVYLN